MSAELEAFEVETRRLLALPGDEKEVFELKCAVSKQLEGIAKTLKGAEGDGEGGDGTPQRDEDSKKKDLAVAMYLMGILSVDGEDWSTGQRQLTESVGLFEQYPRFRDECLQDAYNALGILWFNRSARPSVSEPKQSLGFLRDAEALYKAASASTTTTDSARARLEQQYTQTLFYLAQALGKLGDDAGSAEYCGTCLRRQLEESGGAGGVNRESWRQNTAQLAMFYTNQEKYATAQYCLAAATALSPPETDPDQSVEANLHIGYVKLAMQRLRTSMRKYEARVRQEGQEPAPSSARAADASASAAGGGTPGDPSTLAVHFPSLAVAVPAEPREGWIVSDFDGAREIFNGAMPHLAKALELYPLDGHVTEHIGLLCDRAALYRNLSVFESNAHRACCMHARRAAPLRPVLRQLNKNIFPGLYKSLLFEIGEAYREIVEIKASSGWPHRKYSAFLKEVSSLSVPAERIGPDEERPWLLAKLALARTLQRMQPDSVAPGDDVSKVLQGMAQALRVHEEFLEYCDTHDPPGFHQERALCKELLVLLPAKMERLRREAAAASSGASDG